MAFTHEQAGLELVAAVEAATFRPSLLVGLGESGLRVARSLSERLGAPAIVFRAALLGLPWRSRFSFGAVTEDEHTFVDPDVVADVALGAREVAQLAKAEAAALRRAPWSSVGLDEAAPAGVGPAELRRLARGRDVLLVVHAISTGYRALAVLAALRAAGAREALVAAPCAASDGAVRVQAVARLLLLHEHDEARYDPEACYRPSAG